MSKGNMHINKSLAKDIENSNVIQELPEIEFEGKMHSLFTPISPIHCSICGNSLNSNCNKHHHDTLIGVTGSANYSDEYNEKVSKSASNIIVEITGFWKCAINLNTIH